MTKPKTAKEFREIIRRWIENQRECLKPLTNDEIKNITIIETIINTRNIEIRDQLIEIRSQIDVPRENMIQQTKQQLTNLIKDLQ